MVLMITSYGFGQRENSYLEQLRDNFTPDDIQIFADSIYDRAKEIIPLLINDIDRDEKVVIGLANPYSSNRAPESWNMSYRGVRSAYFIEFLLRAQSNVDNIQNFRKQNGLPILDDSENSWRNKTSFYFLWNDNVIIKEDFSPLNRRDMKAIKKIYERWWQENKNISIEELRDLYGKKTILEGSPYEWI